MIQLLAWHEILFWCIADFQLKGNMLMLCFTFTHFHFPKTNVSRPEDMVPKGDYFPLNARPIFRAHSFVLGRVISPRFLHLQVVNKNKNKAKLSEN